MALKFVSTGVDADGNEEGYNIDDGTGYVFDSDGNLLDQTTANPISTGKYTPEYLRTNYPGLVAEDPGVVSTIGNFLKSAGSGAFDKIKGVYTKKVNGQDVTDWKAIAATAGGLYGLYQSQNNQQQPTGYQGKVPKLEAVREQVANTYDPTRRPGSKNQTYFTDTKYVAPADVAAARTAASTQAAGLETLNRANPAKETIPVAATSATTTAATNTAAGLPASDVIKTLPVPKYAEGGIANMTKGRYLGGATDGMADKIPARIGENQEARLSHGEFVVPADVVGHLGNGNSEAGAKRLYEMMDRIRQARTGNPKQGKQINPNKFLPV
jgi:hypothetical protein